MQGDIKTLFARHEEWSFVFVSANGEVYSSKKKGIAPMMELLKGNAQPFADGIIGDKVVGKAAAHLAIFGGAKEVYAKTISEPALLLLQKYNILCTYEKKVAYIKNRDKTGRCPMETKVWDIEEPNQAYEILKAAVK